MPGLINKYIDFFPDNFKQLDTEQIITLQEGNTPLIKADNLCRYLDINLNLFLKFEGTNPTGSFKDRGMTVAVTNAKLNNKTKAIICASTGNTSAAAAAYAAKANLKSIVIIPEGQIARGKLVQAIVTGSKVVQISGNFDDAMGFVKNLEDSGEIAIVNSINPFRLLGQKTIAYEVIEQLRSVYDCNIVPDYHCLPVGNAGNITAHWMGYSDFYNKKIINNRPIMLGYQASGAAPFLHGKAINKPETVATAIRIGNPQSWDGAHRAVHESNGWFEQVTDQEILTMQKLIAANEGIFCEPASAASVAGLYKDYKNNKIKKNSESLIICTLTGHGLKDPDIILDNIDFNNSVIKIGSDLNKIKEVL